MTNTLNLNQSKYRLGAFDEEMLKVYSSNENILHALKCAYLREKNFREGGMLNSGTSLVRGQINEQSGFWEVEVEVDHGNVYYTSEDPDGNIITIFSLPNDKYIINKDDLSEADINAVRLEHSNTITIDLKDTKSLRKAKDMFAEDYVLKHLTLHHLENENAARFLVWHIKAYKKIFINYMKKYRFLWERLSLKCASSVFFAMVERGLITEEELLKY